MFFEHFGQPKIHCTSDLVESYRLLLSVGFTSRLNCQVPVAHGLQDQ